MGGRRNELKMKKGRVDVGVLSLLCRVVVWKLWPHFYAAFLRRRFFFGKS